MTREPEAQAMQYQGHTATQLSVQFGLKVGEVIRKLAPVPPAGQRNGKDVYAMKEAAPYLAKLPDNVVAQVMRLNHMDLPPMLRKEFWTGQNARLKFEKDQGELWDTQTVVEYVSEAFKTIRMSLLLLSDGVERDTVLSDVQRDTIKNLIDSTLEDIRERLSNQFRARFDDDDGRPGGGRSVDPAAADTGWPADTEGL